MVCHRFDWHPIIQYYCIVLWHMFAYVKSDSEVFSLGYLPVDVAIDAQTVSFLASNLLISLFQLLGRFELVSIS